MAANATPSQIRAFVAAPLPSALLDRVKAQQEQLNRQLGSVQVRWMRPEQLHLTLKFFGNVSSERVQDLTAAIQQAAESVPEFGLSVEGVGCFPSFSRPNVIWLGLSGGVAALQHLQAQIEHQTRDFGSHSEDRVFHPHLTIGRLKTPGPAARKFGEAVQSLTVVPLGQWQVRHLELIRSQLSPAGSQYTVLATVPLLHAQ